MIYYVTLQQINYLWTMICAYLIVAKNNFFPKYLLIRAILPNCELYLSDSRRECALHKCHIIFPQNIPTFWQNCDIILWVDGSINWLCTNFPPVRCFLWLYRLAYFAVEWNVRLKPQLNQSITALQYWLARTLYTSIKLNTVQIHNVCYTVQNVRKVAQIQTCDSCDSV